MYILYINIYVATPQPTGPDAPCWSGRQDLCHARTDSKQCPGSNLSACTVRDPWNSDELRCFYCYFNTLILEPVGLLACMFESIFRVFDDEPTPFGIFYISELRCWLGVSAPPVKYQAFFSRCEGAWFWTPQESLHRIQWCLTRLMNEPLET